MDTRHDKRPAAATLRPGFQRPDEPLPGGPTSQITEDEREGEDGGVPHPPERRLSRVALWGAALLSLVSIAAGTGFVLLDAERQRAIALADVALHAKVLEDQTSRAVAAAETVMRVVADALGETGGAQRLSSLLNDSVRRQPLLRSLSVLDGRGRVLASSQPDNVGRSLPPGLFGPAPAQAGEARLGALLTGRDLPDLAAQVPGHPVTAYALPLLRWLPDERGQASLLLVALINPDHLATEHERMLSETGLHAALLTDRGQLLSGPPELEPGVSLGHLPVFRQYLPAREHASYLGAGVGGAPAVTAFRASRRWPLVVLVEQPYAQVQERIRATARTVAGLATLICALIGAAAWLLHRSLSRDEQHARRLRAAQSAARDIELRRRAILEASIDAIITLDAEGTVVDFNPAAELVFGRVKADIVQCSIFDLLAPHARSGYRDALRQHLAGRDSRVINRRVEIDAQRADGQCFSAEMTMVPVHAGKRLYFTVTLRDITERRQVEMERAALLARYQSLAIDLERQKLALDEHAIVSITDAQGNITYANTKLAEVSGYTAEELLGHKHSVLKSGRQSAEVYQALWQTITRGGIWHGELVNRRKNGRLYWVASTIVPVPGKDGRPRQFISIQTDISALRQAELALADAHRRELEIAARIQQSLLVTPPSRQMPGLWVSVHNQASQGIDGDFVEVFQLGAGVVDLVVGDVMGKGLSAALMGAATKLQFSRSMTELLARSGGEHPQPAQVVAAVHEAMTPHLQALEAFVTLCYVRLDIRHHRLSWVGCGHEEPLLLNALGAVQHLGNQHPPLGVLAHDSYQQGDKTLMAGDMLFLCSDGVTDALRADGERVGHERVLAALGRLVPHQVPATTLLARLRQMLLHEGVSLNDDVTMVMAQLPEGGERAERLELAPSLQSLAEVRDFVGGQCARIGLGEDETALFNVAAVEAFTNAVRHTVNRPDGVPIELLARRDALDEVLTLELVCLGEAFDPGEAPHPEDTDFSGFPEGGFGLTIIQQACDSVGYLHAEGVNTVRMVCSSGLGAADQGEAG